MAPETEHERIRVILDYAPRMLDELVERAAEWDDHNEAERSSFWADWDMSFLGDLKWLIAAYRRGAMTARQRQAFDALMRRLSAVRESARRTEVLWPDWLEEFLTGYLQQAAAAGD